MTRSGKRSIAKTVGSILFYCVLALILAGTIMFATSTDEKKSIFGYRFYEVLSGSMRPTIDVGELVIIKLVEPQDVRVGDIVTKSVAANGAVTVTHRVIDTFVAEDGTAMITTQGDNNDIADEPIPVSAVIGTVQTHIPYLGHAVGFVKSNVLFCVFVVVAVCVLILALRVIFGKKPQKASPEMMEQRASELEDEATRLRERAQQIRFDQPDGSRVTSNERDASSQLQVQHRTQAQAHVISSTSEVASSYAVGASSVEHEALMHDHVQTIPSEQAHQSRMQYDPALAYIEHVRTQRVEQPVVEHASSASAQQVTTSSHSPSSHVASQRHPQPTAQRQGRNELMRGLRQTVLQGIYESHRERQTQTISQSEHIPTNPYVPNVTREKGERILQPVVPIE